MSLWTVTFCAGLIECEFVYEILRRGLIILNFVEVLIEVLYSAALSTIILYRFYLLSSHLSFIFTDWERTYERFYYELCGCIGTSNTPSVLSFSHS